MIEQLRIILLENIASKKKPAAQAAGADPPPLKLHR